MLRFRPDGSPEPCCFGDAIAAVLSFLDVGGGAAAAAAPEAAAIAAPATDLGISSAILAGSGAGLPALAAAPEAAALGFPALGAAGTAALGIPAAINAASGAGLPSFAPGTAATGFPTAGAPIGAGGLGVAAPEQVTVTGPLAPPTPSPALGAGPLVPATAALTAAGAPLTAPTTPPSGPTGISSTGTATSTSATSQPLSVPGPTGGGGAAGGGVASASGTAAPSSVPLQSGDVTQGVGTAATQPGNLPGAVGNGAAAGGTASNIPGSVNITPSQYPSAVDRFLSSPTLSGAGDALGQGANAVGAGIGKAADYLVSNPLNTLTAGILGFDALKSQQPPKYSSAIASNANAAAQNATKLEGYLNSGQLPPGLMAGINQAAAAASASIKARYAAQGMSGSSAEAEDLSNLSQRISGQIADTALSLFQQGISESQISAQLFDELMNTAISQDNQLGSAVGNLSLALSGGTQRAGATGG